MHLRGVAPIVCLLVLPALLLNGQVTTGTILGTVTDASGAVVAGAKVTITETSKGTSQDYTTDDTGFYMARMVQ